MGQNKMIRRTIIFLILILLLGNIEMGYVTVKAPDGLWSVAGRVCTSEGENPDGGFEGTYAAVIIEHNGIKSTYMDSDGLILDESDGSYWYSIVLPYDAWDYGDVYWVQVDGTGWGDLNHTCVEHDNSDIDSWEIISTTEMRNVNTVNETAGFDVDNSGNGGTTTDDEDYLMQYLLIGMIILIVVFVIVIIILLFRPKRKEK